MSGLTAPGRGPDNDPELLAQMYADIQKLKRGEVLRAGEWSIYTDPETGNLMKSRPGRVEGVGTEAEPEITDLTAERGFILKDVANAIYEGVTQETIPADAPDKGLPDIRDVLSNIPAISVPDLIGGFAAIWNEWFDRSDGSGSVPELTYTIGAIKDAVINGYNVIGFSTSVAGYVVPMHVEARAILVGGGQNGLSGSTGGRRGHTRHAGRHRRQPVIHPRRQRQPAHRRGDRRVAPARIARRHRRRVRSRAHHLAAGQRGQRRQRRSWRHGGDPGRVHPIRHRRHGRGGGQLRIQRRTRRQRRPRRQDQERRRRRRWRRPGERRAQRRW
jgi:hypothetical protein